MSIHHAEYLKRIIKSDLISAGMKVSDFKTAANETFQIITFAGGEQAIVCVLPVVTAESLLQPKPKKRWSD